MNSVMSVYVHSKQIMSGQSRLHHWDTYRWVSIPHKLQAFYNLPKLVLLNGDVFSLLSSGLVT
jgi:hypothetical protein